MYNLSKIMTRAWQLARMNRRTANEKFNPDFSRWLRLAWTEAKEPPEPQPSRVERIRGEIIALQGASLNMRIGPRLDALRAQLAEAA